MKRLLLILIAMLCVGLSAQDSKISQLPVATVVNLSDIIVIVQGGDNKQATKAVFLDEVIDSLAQHRIELDNLTDTSKVFRDSLDSYDTRIDAAGGSYTAGDALRLDGTEFNLGGPIGSPVVVSSSLYLEASGSNISFANKQGDIYNNFLVTAGSSSLRTGSNPVTGLRADFRVSGSGTDPYYGQARMAMYDQVSSTLFKITLNSQTETALITDSRATTAGLEYEADYSDDFTDRTLVDKGYVDAKSSTTSYTSCTYNATTNIIVEAVSVNTSYQLHYMAKRDIGTVQLQSGSIKVQYDAVSGGTAQSSSYVGPDLGFTITSDYSGGNLRLNIVVDNAYSENVSFDFKTMSKFTE